MATRLLIAIALAGCGNDPASCDRMADHVRDLMQPIDEHAHAIRDVFEARCRDDGWSREVRTCIADTTPAGSNHCRSKLAPTQLSALERDLDVVAARFDPEIPRACTDYKALLDRVARCTALDADVRERLPRNLAELEPTWSTRDPHEVAAECTAASQALIGAAPSCLGQ